MARLNVDVRLEQGIQVLNASGRDLRRNHGETSAAAGKGIDVLRVEHGAGLNFIARGIELQALYLSDIDAEITNWHTGRKFIRIKGV